MSTPAPAGLKLTEGMALNCGDPSSCVTLFHSPSAIFASASVGVSLPPRVALVPNNFPAPNPKHAPVRQQRVHLRLVGVLDHRDAAAEDRHAVAPHQSSVPLAPGVVLRAFPDQVIEPRRVEA